MKSLFILERPHSIVDIITNSSTEMFVSSTENCRIYSRVVGRRINAYGNGSWSWRYLSID